MIEVSEVAAAHDAMAAEYDVLNDLWYPHLFNEIHRLILRHLPQAPGASALDVGCGTGMQSLFAARAGYACRGFDIASALVACAGSKLEAARRDGVLPFPGYQTSLQSFARDQEVLVHHADSIRGSASYISPVFEIGDAADPESYQEGGYSVIMCCGSVLSFIDRYDSVLAQFAAALRPGGLLFLEVEQRTTLDLLWPMIDRLLAGRLEYGQPLSESLGNAFAPAGQNIRVDYPFTLHTGEEVVLPIWLFSVGYLARAFSKLRLEVVDRIGIHSVTNLIPSTVLHHSNPPRRRLSLFERLAKLEARTNRRWPIWRTGCSVAFVLRKV